MTLRLVINPADQASDAAASAGAVVVATDGAGTTSTSPALVPDQVAVGVAELALPRAWRCSRAGRGECGWSGVAQDGRSGPPSIRVDLGEELGIHWQPNEDAATTTWASSPWCPRCGAEAVPLADPPKSETWYLVDDVDVPSGQQPAELRAVAADTGRPIEERFAALLALLPPA